MQFTNLELPHFSKGGVNPARLTFKDKIGRDLAMKSTFEHVFSAISEN